MNPLLLVISIAVIFSYVHATILIDNVDTIKKLLQDEKTEELYRPSVGNAVGPRLSKRTPNNIRAQCDQALGELHKLGTLQSQKHANFEKFSKEDAGKLLSYELMELPIEDMPGKERMVVRITDKPYLKERDARLDDLKSPILYPNGLFIADSSFNQNMVYLFTKTPGHETLLPIALLPCSSTLVEPDCE